MPIYEFVCKSCQKSFSDLVSMDERPVCPKCGSKKVEKEFSVFASQASTSKKTSSLPSSQGHHCHGGACGCGG